MPCTAPKTARSMQGFLSSPSPLPLPPTCPAEPSGTPSPQGAAAAAACCPHHPTPCTSTSSIRDALHRHTLGCQPPAPCPSPLPAVSSERRWCHSAGALQAQLHPHGHAVPTSTAPQGDGLGGPGAFLAPGRGGEGPRTRAGLCSPQGATAAPCFSQEDRGMRRGKEPRCWGESLVPSPAYSGILMKRRVSSSLIYHIM